MEGLGINDEFYNSWIWVTIIIVSALLQFYTDNAFGLKTLDETGRLHIYEIPGVQHIHWHGNKTVFDSCIEPWLT